MATHQVWLTASEEQKVGEIAAANGLTVEQFIQEMVRGRIKAKPGRKA
jgi:hypothetical protein